MSLLLKNGTVVNDDEMFKADVLVRDGKIVYVIHYSNPETYRILIQVNTVNLYFKFSAVAIIHHDHISLIRWFAKS